MLRIYSNSFRGSFLIGLHLKVLQDMLTCIDQFQLIQEMEPKTRRQFNPTGHLFQSLVETSVVLLYYPSEVVTRINHFLAGQTLTPLISRKCLHYTLLPFGVKNIEGLPSTQSSLIQSTYRCCLIPGDILSIEIMRTTKRI